MAAVEVSRNSPPRSRSRRAAATVVALVLMGAGATACGEGAPEATLPVNGEGAPVSAPLVDKLVTDYLEANNLPGATVAVTRASRLVHSKGYGYANTATKTEMLPQHRSLFGSVAKMLTTVGVMRLVEKGDLALDSFVYSDTITPIWGKDPGATPGTLVSNNGILADPGDFASDTVTGVEALNPLYPPIAPSNPSPATVNSYRAEVEQKLGWLSNIRLRHLLSHTAGFLNSGSIPAAAADLGKPGEDLTYREIHQAMLRGVFNPPLLFAPGSNRAYSNHGFGLTGMVVDEVTGMPYVDYMRKHVFEPLGLPHVQPRFMAFSDRDAFGHTRDGDGDPVPIPQVVLAKPEVNNSTGGWVATAQDLSRVMCSMDRTSNHLRILKPATVTTMESDAIATIPGRPLGWDSRTASNELVKGGLTTGGRGFVMKFLPGAVSPDEINVAIGINLRHAPGQTELLTQIAQVVAAVEISPDYDLYDPAYRCFKPVTDLAPAPPSPTPDVSTAPSASPTPSQTPSPTASGPTLGVPTRTPTPSPTPTPTKTPTKAPPTTASPTPNQPPTLRWATIDPEALCTGQSALVRAHAVDDKDSGANLTVRFTHIEGGKTKIVEMPHVGGGIYEGTFVAGAELGEKTITVYAMDSKGAAAKTIKLQVTVVCPG